jgi:hypothetical protein
VSNFVTDGGREHSIFVTSSSIAASKMGHSNLTDALAYASERLDDESHFNAYHSAIGNSPHQVATLRMNTLSLGDIRSAMSLRYPDSLSRDGHNYLSSQQKELVEFAYVQESSKEKHCFGLLSPGKGKSEVYIIPTNARRLANQQSKTIIHVSPYSFLGGISLLTPILLSSSLGLIPAFQQLFSREGTLQSDHCLMRFPTRKLSQVYCFLILMQFTICSCFILNI